MSAWHVARPPGFFLNTNEVLMIDRDNIGVSIKIRKKILKIVRMK